VSGKTSGMNYVYIYLNGEVVKHSSSGVYTWMNDMAYEAGDPMKVQVLSNQFTAEVPLTSVNTRDGDIKNVIQVKGVDNVGNEGELSDSAEVPPIRMLDTLKSLNVAITEQAFGLSDSVDQLKEMSVTFLQFPPGDFLHHTITMTYHAMTPDVDKSAISMIGYWTVDTDVTGDYRAKIRIVFQHPSISAFKFENLKLVTLSAGETSWRVIEDAVFVHQAADPGQGIPEVYYVEATVNSFSDFAIIQGKPDLQMDDTHIFANPLVGGQEVRISATVKNVGKLAMAAENVVVRVYYTDEDGAESTIGWIDLGTVEPGKDNAQTGEVLWTTPVVTDVEKMTFYIHFKIDPNATVAEYDESNNYDYIDENNDNTIDPIEVLRVSYSVSSFSMTFAMAVVSATLVVGMTIVRKRRK